MALSDLIARVGIDVTGFTDGLSQISKDVDKAVRDSERSFAGFDKLGSVLSGIGTSLTAAITLPLVGIATAAAKFSTDFNASMANVATLIPNSTARVNELKLSVQEMAIATGKSTKDLTGGLYQVISAFGDTSDTVKILEINARAAAAGLATTADAINLTSAITKAYGDTSAEAVQKVSDLAFQAVKLGVTTFPELAGSMGTVTPMAQSMGVSLEELFGIYATLTGVTGNTDEVTTQFKGTLTGFAKPSEDMKVALKKIGFESGQTAVQTLGLKGTLDKLLTVVGGNTLELAKLFENTRAWVGIQALAGSQSETFKAKMIEMGNATGATTAAFDEQTKGINKLGFQWEQMKQQLAVIAQKLGDALAPAFAAALQAAQPLLDFAKDAVIKFDDLSVPVKQAGIAFAVFAASIGPIIFISGQLISSISSISSGIAALGAVGVTASGTLTAVGVALTAVAVALSIFEVKDIATNFVSLADAIKLVSSESEDCEISLKGFDGQLQSVDPRAVLLERTFVALGKAWNDFRMSLSNITWLDALLGPLGNVNVTLKNIRDLILAGPWAPKVDTKPIENGLKAIQEAQLKGAKATADHQLAVDALAGSQRKATGDAKAHGDATEASAKQLAAAAKSAQELESALRLLGVSADGPTAKLASMKVALDLILKSMLDGKTTYQQFSDAVDHYAKALDDANPQTIRANDILKEYHSTLKEMPPSIKDIDDKLNVLYIELERHPEKWREINNAIDLLKDKKALLKEQLADPLFNLAEAIQANFDKFQKFNEELGKTTQAADYLNPALDAISTSITNAGIAAIATQFETAKVVEAYHVFALQSPKEMDNAAKQIAAAYKVLEDSNTASTGQLLKAWIEMTEAQIAASLAAGRTIDENQRHDLAIAKQRLHDYIAGSSAEWREFVRIGKEAWGQVEESIVSTIMTGKDFGDSMIAIAKDVAGQLVKLFVHTAFKEILDGMKGMNVDFGKMINNIKNLFTDLGKHIKAVFGVGSSAVEGAAGAAGSGAGAAGGLLGSGGVFGAITGAVDAVTGVLQYLQGRRMEQDIGRIEVTTREIKAETENRRKDAWDQHNSMYDRLGEVWQSMMDKFDLTILTIAQVRDAIGGGGGGRELPPTPPITYPGEPRESPGTGRGGERGGTIISAIEDGADKTAGVIEGSTIDTIAGFGAGSADVSRSVTTGTDKVTDGVNNINTSVGGFLPIFNDIKSSGRAIVHAGSMISVGIGDGTNKAVLGFRSVVDATMQAASGTNAAIKGFEVGSIDSIRFFKTELLDQLRRSVKEPLNENLKEQITQGRTYGEAIKQLQIELFGQLLPIGTAISRLPGLTQEQTAQFMAIYNEMKGHLADIYGVEKYEWVLLSDISSTSSETAIRASETASNTEDTAEHTAETASNTGETARYVAATAAQLSQMNAALLKNLDQQRVPAPLPLPEFTTQPFQTNTVGGGGSGPVIQTVAGPSTTTPTTRTIPAGGGGPAILPRATDNLIAARPAIVATPATVPSVATAPVLDAFQQQVQDYFAAANAGQSPGSFPGFVPYTPSPTVLADASTIIDSVQSITNQGSAVPSITDGFAKFTAQAEAAARILGGSLADGFEKFIKALNRLNDAAAASGGRPIRLEVAFVGGGTPNEFKLAVRDALEEVLGT